MRISIFIFIICIGFVSAYTAPSLDSVDLVLDTGYTAPSFDSVDLVLGEPSFAPLISIERIYPTGNINVTQNEFFNVTLNVTCLQGNCGTINVSLDPIIVLQNATTENLANAYLDEANPDTNYGGGSWIYAGANSEGGELSFLLKFNLSSVPENSTVLSARAGVYIAAKTDFSDTDYVNISIYSMPDNWSEDNITWNNAPSPNTFINKTAMWDTGFTQKLIYWGIGTEYINLSEENVSFFFNATDSLPNNTYGSFRTANFVIESLRPLLEITYTTTNQIKSGLIDTTIGATPFYTNSSTNPVTSSSLSSGQSETITFWVNATGINGTIHNFYAYANTTTNTSISNVTTNWNVTILEEVAPVDSCTYTSGDWIVDCEDGCNITSNVDLGGSDILFNNSGFFFLKANITNRGELNFGDPTEICQVVTFDNTYLIK